MSYIKGKIKREWARKSRWNFK